MPKFSECTKPHALVHLVTGAGLGLVVAGLVPDLASNALTMGIILVVVAVVLEFVVNKE